MGGDAEHRLGDEELLQELIHQAEVRAEAKALFMHNTKRMERVENKE